MSRKKVATHLPGTTNDGFLIGLFLQK